MFAITTPLIPGATFGVSQGTPESFEYIAGLPSSGGEIPVDMTAREVPAGDYARVAHTAPAADSEAEKFADALKRPMPALSAKWPPPV